MASFYFDLHDGVVHEMGSKYHVVHSRTGDAMMAGGYWITQHSNRIWKEDSSGVCFVKNRYNLDYKTVDLKEFMWVKLQAKEVK